MGTYEECEMDNPPQKIILREHASHTKGGEGGLETIEGEK